MRTMLAKAIRIGAGIWFAFSGAALMAAAFPVGIAGGDDLIAVMFLPVGAFLLRLSLRWIGPWAWAIAAVVLGYFGIAIGLAGVPVNGVDAGSGPHIAGWLTAVAAIPIGYLAVRGLRRQYAAPPPPPTLP
jgi:hypothetical protein